MCKSSPTSARQNSGFLGVSVPPFSYHRASYGTMSPRPSACTRADLGSGAIMRRAPAPLVGRFAAASLYPSPTEPGGGDRCAYRRRRDRSRGKKPLPPTNEIHPHLCLLTPTLRHVGAMREMSAFQSHSDRSRKQQRRREFPKAAGVVRRRKRRVFQTEPNGSRNVRGNGRSWMTDGRAAGAGGRVSVMPCRGLHRTQRGPGWSAQSQTNDCRRLKRINNG